MNLILTDMPLSGIQIKADTWLVDLTQQRVANCLGCFGCWVKTPGRCVIRDDAPKIYPKIAVSDRVIYVTRVVFGGYDTPMKTLLERSIPVQQPFIRVYRGETHHVQRDVLPKNAVIIAYGTNTTEEHQVFLNLVDRNAYNMCFAKHRVAFVDQSQVEQTVAKEVALWEKQ